MHWIAAKRQETSVHCRQEQGSQAKVIAEANMGVGLVVVLELQDISQFDSNMTCLAKIRQESEQRTMQNHHDNRQVRFAGSAGLAAGDGIGTASQIHGEPLSSSIGRVGGDTHSSVDANGAANVAINGMSGVNVMNVANVAGLNGVANNDTTDLKLNSTVDANLLILLIEICTAIRDEFGSYLNRTLLKLMVVLQFDVSPN